MTVVLARVFRNARLGRDADTCGQAAVATMLAHFGLMPLDAPGLEGLEDGAVIDRIAADFPPDVPFGLGTSAGQMRAALVAYGLAARHVHSGWFGRHLGYAFGHLCAHVAAGLPSIVCLDDGRLGGTPFSAHWAIVTDVRSDSVALAAARVRELTLLEFLNAWRCRQLPWGHNHCALLVER